MKKRRLFAALAMTFAVATVFSACGFGSDDNAEQVVVEETPTPEPTKEPTPEPTPTVGPDIQDTTYTSADRSVSFELPDATWGSKQDQDGLIIVESPAEGKLYITHQSGADMAIIPDTEDMANTLETSGGLVPAEDYEIRNYTRQNINGVEVTSYLVKYTNTEKSEGVADRIWKYFVNAEQNECYMIEAQILQENEELIGKVQASVDSFKILSDSPLAAATSADPVGEAQGETPAGGADAAQANGGFTEEQLNDTNQTRTIYTNDGAGRAIVVTPDGTGSWVDNQGNTYRFADDGSTVYDQNDVDYYYGGESANVYYMTAE